MLSSVKLFILGAFLFTSFASAQQSEIGLWLGTSNYFGDLNIGSPFSTFKKTRPAGGFTYRYNIIPYMAAKATLGYGRITATDEDSTNPFNQRRNLSFFSDIIELSGQLEFHFNYFKSKDPNHSFTPYLTLGLAAFYFNPKAELNGETYVLRDYGTEGQNAQGLSGLKPYKRLQLSLPLGLGLKYWLSNNWNMTIEYAYRFTFTDYIDDVSGVYVDPNAFGSDAIARALADRSGENGGDLIGETDRQRGDSISNDAYLMGGISLTYMIFRVKCKK